MANKKHKITIYGTEQCHFCHAAKDYFKENKIDFKDLDVGENKAAAKEMVKKSGQMGVPVIIIDDQVIVGFDKPKIEEILKK